MARYNRWQNVSLYGAAETLSDDARRADRGAFFKSIHATLNHLMWADAMWMSRFTGGPRPAGRIPESTSFVDDWEALRRERAACDERIILWAEGLDAAALAGELTWRPATALGEVEVSRPRCSRSCICSTTRPIIAARRTPCSPPPARSPRTRT